MSDRQIPALSSLFAGCALLLIRLPGAHADVIPPCPVPAGVQTSASLETLPPALKAKLKELVGDIVRPNAPFDASDFVRTGHNRRLIFIWTRQDRWIIATEHGGLGYNDPVFAFSLSSDRTTTSLLAQRIAIPNTVCAKAEELLQLQ